MWTIPQGIHADNSLCVIRIRYNISTGDYDGWNTDRLMDGENSILKTNPAKDYVGLGVGVSGIKNING